ncbi:hypothetical protein IQ06DRAFT_362031 [Phaeosphaeriaceae sp. SRC1lsM3a]|nr:hypothetical protein IQ06DRAFT_362031 [Stagonospora sp. SRC1lsM3a]
MATIPRELFPNLPPELRHEVYSYLSGSRTVTTASVVGLPLKLKHFDCKHTSVQICPVHYESAGLLALEKYRFQEAFEYNSWLLDNAVDLDIGVTFKGRVNTFVQSDWDSKMKTHLRKLAKQHPWLAKVARYNIQILWRPVDGAMKSKNNKRTAGQIVRDMAATLTSLVHDDVKRKRGKLLISLRLDHTAAAQTVVAGTRFGFADFFFPVVALGFREQTREAWKHAHKKPVEEERVYGLVPFPSRECEGKVGMEIRNGVMKWEGNDTGLLLMKRHLLEDKIVGMACGNEKDEGGHVLLTLLGECLG